jgi:hypothetical protein
MAIEIAWAWKSIEEGCCADWRSYVWAPLPSADGIGSLVDHTPAPLPPLILNEDDEGNIDLFNNNRLLQFFCAFFEWSLALNPGRTSRSICIDITILVRRGNSASTRGSY